MADLKTAYTDGARNGFLRLGAVLARRGATADMLTIAGLLLQIVTVPFILTGHFILAAVVFLVASVCDALDGAVARAGAGATQAGAFLDSATDRISELIVSAALVIYMARQERWYECVAVLVVMGAAQMVSYARARAEALGVECKVGLMSRPERIVLLGVGFLLAGVQVFGVSLLTVTVYVLAALTAYTVWQRIQHVMRALRSPSDGSSEDV